MPTLAARGWDRTVGVGATRTKRGVGRLHMLSCSWHNFPIVQIRKLRLEEIKQLGRARD